MTWTQLWLAVFGAALALVAAADIWVLLRAARRVSREADEAAARRKAGGLSVSDDTGLYPPYREWRSRTRPMLTPDDPDQP